MSPRLLVVVASMRRGRVGGAVGRWVIDAATQHRFEVDVADLAELRLPLMEEPNHPKLKQYTEPHTLAWSRQVEAADAVIFVMPEYNHSFSAPLKNAIDYLYLEWSGKPVGLVSYGGLAGGTRAVVALQPVMANLGMVGLPANVELAWVAEQTSDDVFTATDRQQRALESQLDQLTALATVGSPGTELEFAL